MRKKIYKIALLLITFLVIASCTNTYYRDYIPQAKGIKEGKYYRLESLKKYRDPSGELSGSAGFLFFVGAADIDGKFRTESMISFAVRSDKGIVAVVEFPISKIDFKVVEAGNNPAVKFRFNRNSAYGKKDYVIRKIKRTSLAGVLQKYVTKVTIKLSKKLFSEEVAPYNISPSQNTKTA